jgi:hypothetical protein
MAPPSQELEPPINPERFRIYAMQRFVKTIRQDLEAVRSAVMEPGATGRLKDRSTN